MNPDGERKHSALLARDDLYREVRTVSARYDTGALSQAVVIFHTRRYQPRVATNSDVADQGLYAVLRSFAGMVLKNVVQYNHPKYFLDGATKADWRIGSGTCYIKTVPAAARRQCHNQ